LPLGFARPRRRYRSARTGVPHRARPLHSHRHPLHVTLRRASRLPSMREEALFLVLRRALSRTARSWFRVVQFSVQTDHVHLIVEALDKPSLSRGMTGLCVRLARAFNGALDRCGAVWGERYHARALRTHREVRNGLVYVLMNHRKHAIGSNTARQGFTRPVFDVCSSAWWFDGWDRPPSSGPPLAIDVAPVMPAETWLVRTGWQRYGSIRLDECPKGSGHARTVADAERA
jgi:putative transposase